ncbi:unnamed protein product [Tuber melanosporum]|uniref:(Perigord truffle) hypothetical protein n=1 Tax=Tuber melanosporum (strain Mel28) TaxID=656061 RepID=D5GAG7_TUBMM|nr:uncharacterized protein GSTUM_00003636001 [Tuber melanosporum]CAZ81510.1 unnamed protein product [Tuber melanosporum]
MKTTIFSSTIAIFATLATALPATAPADPAVTPGAGITTRDHVKQVISSSAVVTINEDTPDTALGIVDKAIVSRVDSKQNSQALLKFDFPEGLTGYKCRLAFGHSTQFGGTGKIQVFAIGDANIAGATFNKRPFRDQFKATFRVAGWGEATVVDGPGLTFDCPFMGAKAYEVISVGDNNQVVWYAPWGGLRIDVL